MRYYLGYKNGLREIFQSQNTPTRESNSFKYNAVVGPFRTKRGAKAMLHYGNGNPHLRTVADAERIGLQYKDELAKL